MNRLPVRTAVAGLVAVLLGGACTLPLAEVDAFGADDALFRSGPPGIVTVKWQLMLSRVDPFEPAVEERATVGFADDGDLFVGSALGKVMRLDAVTRARRWELSVDGGVDCTPMQPPGSELVYFGSDDGAVYAVDAKLGLVRWKFNTRGEVDGPLAFGGGKVVFTNGANVLYALDAHSGKLAWSARRDMPESFTVRGSSPPTVSGERVLAGFADGTLAAFDLRSGVELWSRNLARGAKTFRDVDGRPLVVGERVYAASFSGGLHALTLDAGHPVWHRSDAKGVGSVVAVDDVLYFAGTTTSIVESARASDGRPLWATRVHDTGAMTDPVVVRGTVFVGAHYGGLIAFDRRTGKLLKHFAPGSPIGTPPGVTWSGLYVTSVGGYVYRLDWI